jgi:hypothetical protein
MPESFFLLPDAAGNGKGVLPAVPVDRYRGLALLAGRCHPAYFVPIEPFVESNPHNSGVGVADGDYMFVGSQLAKFFFDFVPPGKRGQQTRITTAALFIGEEFGKSLAAVANPHVPAVGSFFRLIYSSDILVLFEHNLFLGRFVHGIANRSNEGCVQLYYP